MRGECRQHRWTESDRLYTGLRRYALCTELGEHAATDASLPEMRRYVGLGRDTWDELGVLPS